MTQQYKPPRYEESFTDPGIVLDGSRSTSVDYACGDQPVPALFYDVIEGVSRRRISRSNLDRLHRELTRYKGSLMETYNYLRMSIERTPAPSKTSIFDVESCATCVEGGIEEKMNDTCVDMHLEAELQLPVSVSSMTLQYVQYQFQNLIKYAIDSYWNVKESSDKNKSSSSSVELPGNLIREPHAIRSCPSNATSYTDAVNKDAPSREASLMSADQFVSVPDISTVTTTTTEAPVEAPATEKVSEVSCVEPSYINEEGERAESSVGYCTEEVDISAMNRRMLIGTVVFNVALYMFIHSSATKKTDVAKAVYLTSLDQLMLMVDD